ncbi:MAG: EthD domain-containing protein [Myxococcota bacterium]
MVKLVFCCRRKPDMSVEEFQRRWLDVHGPLVRKLRAKLPMMKRYVQSHTLPGPMNDELAKGRGTAPAYDGITEVWFDDLASMAGEGEDAAAAGRALFEDEAEFIDFARSSVFLTVEHEIF